MGFYLLSHIFSALCISYSKTIWGIIHMNDCSDLYILSTIACKLSECLTEEELTILSANLVALGDMLEVILAHQSVCKKSE